MSYTVLDDLCHISLKSLSGLRQASSRLIDVLAAEQQRGTHPVMRLLGRKSAFSYWDHLPRNDVRDATSGACWFYHAHPPDSARADPDEHGHFHCFIHRRHAARYGQCLAGPPRGPKKYPHLSHLAALAIRHDGVPLRWFAVAQPVTDDYVYPAEAMISAQHKFDFAARGPLAPTTKWLQAMVGIYAPVINTLLKERDTARKRATADTEILASVPLQFEEYLEKLANLLD